MTQLVYDNFDLQIETVSRNRYRVQVLESTAGQAEHEFRPPFSKLQLDGFYGSLGQSRQVLREFETRAPQHNTESAQEFGERLFSSLFGPSVYACYRSSLAEARSNGRGLRIRLRLNSAELSALPWEFLYDPNVHMYLARSIDTPIVRYIELPYKDPVLLVKPPLNMLVMIANPLQDLDVEKEWRLLSQALEPLQQRGLLHVERMERANLDGLQRRLRQGNTHIFHFMGHGDYREQDQDGGLLFEDEAGQEMMLSGDQLGAVLHNHRALRLVVLNACEGGRSSIKDPFSGVAQRLVEMGIPAVVAMQFPVSDISAITFASQFYGALADGFPVDAALVEARNAISARSQDLEWGTPVYFTRADDGQVFDIQTAPTAPVSEMQPGVSPSPAASLSAPPASARAEPASSSTRGGDRSLAGASSSQPAASPAAPRVSPALLWAGGLLALFGLSLILFLQTRPERSVVPESTRQLAAMETVYAYATQTAVTAALVDPAQPTTKPDVTALPSETRQAITSSGTASPEAATGVAATTEELPKPTTPFTPDPTVTFTMAAPTSAPTDNPSAATASAATAPAATAPPATAELGQVWIRPKDSMPMVYIPDGEFAMGALARDRDAQDDEKPQHTVFLDAYWIDQTEVTNGMFRGFLEASSFNWKGAFVGGDTHPVVNVTWTEAAAYCKWAGGRLPSDAQWEKAARGTDKRLYPWGDQSPSCDLAVMNEGGAGCGKELTWPVGSKPAGASPYGALDMAGNAWEWVLDWYNASYYFRSPLNNPPGASSGEFRFIRGGSGSDGPRNLRTTNHNQYIPTTRLNNLGFRCVR